MSASEQFTVNRRTMNRSENIEHLRPAHDKPIGRYVTYAEAVAARNLFESKDGGLNADGTVFTSYHVAYPAGE